MKLPPHYRFRDTALAQLAFTHKSYGAPNNERLEWLGDAVVEFEVSRLLYQAFPGTSEGGLSQLRANLVSRPALAALARRLGLGDCALLGGTHMRGGRNNDNLLANLAEAYIAAVYLDGGDVAALLQSLLEDDIAALAAKMEKGGIRALENPKSQLQEWLQRNKQPPPAYALLEQQGKSDKPVFIAECRTAAGAVQQGRGRTRAAAEAAAAAACLRQLAGK